MMPSSHWGSRHGFGVRGACLIPMPSQEQPYGLLGLVSMKKSSSIAREL
jgi:hypothetical protein